uniref:Helicase C-terminal domain-containing protein n=1 Tax=Grammatophora oceanica TaxID=210454 RepID=A0A7S1VN65_9STRA|mmetsp:Transcript_5116/g.7127  ORF Transcript_5116/g.7127 Transcript_5116/m.7127 type:complete len:191 (+) Transcript_5116:3-575(+)
MNAASNSRSAQHNTQKKKGTSKARRNAAYKQKLKQLELAKRLNMGKGNGVSARQACSILEKYGLIGAQPLHVAMGLEGNEDGDDSISEDAQQLPPFLVTFEGSARGLHLEGVDVVFIVGRPASAASYLHLAGRVGRAAPSDDNDDSGDNKIQIRPGTVVSICTKGSATELEKWTQQIGGNALEEMGLVQP